jgi:hypothetical protein
VGSCKTVTGCIFILLSFSFCSFALSIYECSHATDTVWDVTWGRAFIYGLPPIEGGKLIIDLFGSLVLLCPSIWRYFSLFLFVHQ